jgi:23S rRNA pseudouridine2605 synthase
LIAGSRVQVNGVPATVLGTRVDAARDSITVDGRPVALPAALVYLALHKPRGYVTSVRDPQGRPTVMELVPHVPGLFPVGRLDANTTGLLLMTTDGAWAQRVAHPRYGSEKEYLVEAQGLIAPPVIEVLREPMVLAPGEQTTGAEVEVVERGRDRTRLRIVLHEGRNRQIRRMLDRVGYSALSLQRVRVGNVRLGSLPEGQWRRLTDTEIAPQPARETRRHGDAETWRAPHPLTPSPSRGEGEYEGGALSRAGERGYHGGTTFPSPLRGRGARGEGQPPRPAVRLRRRSA